MYWLYNISMLIYGLLVRLASLFNAKAKLFIEGRKGIFKHISAKFNGNERPIWFHFASLGEFEQGRPVLESIKASKPSEKIIVTFFSPSGYEIRKNYALADGIFYLPLDTISNAHKFVSLVNPKMAIFTKYEFWPNYFNALANQNIPLYIISGIFRSNQIFFKGYGGFYRNVLKCVRHFFVQNKESAALLNNIDIDNVDISGDTRFDRVYENAKTPKKLPIIENFCGEAPVLIAGSTWPEDEKLLVDLATKNPDWKLVIAPHEIHEGHISTITDLFPNGLRFSNLDVNASSEINSQVLIIDNIGMLSSLYQYGQIAYIGGGFGVGIHNTLEAAAFGLPVIFGPNYHKFQEAKDLIEIGAAKNINNAEELTAAFEHYIAHESGTLAKKYVANKKGATEMIMKKIFED
ncbi:3-deoxy-D-manno-octulosonic acid transferase [Pedobacter chitinilyticus]|uniref:3-deoxy-D-manno-octulosonic acid transferase n=2 Tax=Pedobacter chitinilyticus TaxID=2233776 RepID=A0A3S3SQL8_9SPHI|nr:glycosyltransferase N-terminal domain-containing protein [Pedobacter chitinilyticus]RWU05738.1 3-deoxy-D-manno-octulosonic acid transferase [Pedobacter chitinilyticus]